MKESLKEDYDNIQIAVFLLPGRKTDTKYYAPLKRFLNSTLGVPSQVVLNQTIEKGKNLLSIISKIILQIGAKLNKRPWVMENLPLFTEPVMICGFDVTWKSDSSLLSLMFSTDPKAARYLVENEVIWSDASDIVEKI